MSNDTDNVVNRFPHLQNITSVWSSKLKKYSENKPYTQQNVVSVHSKLIDGVHDHLVLKYSRTQYKTVSNTVFVVPKKY